MFKLQILQPVIGPILHFKTGTYRLLGLENFFAEKNFEPNLCQQKIDALENRRPYCRLAPHCWTDEEFVYNERLVGAIPFYNKRHTGDNILKATKECLQKYGCPWDKIIARVSDSGSNMKKAMASLDGFSPFVHPLFLT